MSWNCRELLHLLSWNFVDLRLLQNAFNFFIIYKKRSILRALKRDLEWEILITVGRDSIYFFIEQWFWTAVLTESSHLFWHVLYLSLRYLKGLHKPLKQLNFFSLKSWNSDLNLWKESIWGAGKATVNLKWLINRQFRFQPAIIWAAMEKKASHVISLIKK